MDRIKNFIHFCSFAMMVLVSSTVTFSLITNKVLKSEDLLFYIYGVLIAIWLKLEERNWTQ